MERVSNALSQALKELGIEKAQRVGTLMQRWGKIVGSSVADHTWPVSQVNGQLIIHVDSPEWLHELHYLQNSLLGKLAPYGITAIRMKLGPVKKKRTPGRNIPPSGQISEADRKLIDSTTSSVQDSSLRARIGRAMERSLASPRRPKR